MIRAYRLYTGPDGNSHVTPGSVNGGHLVDVKSIQFKETAAHSSYDWHNDRKRHSNRILVSEEVVC